MKQRRLYDTTRWRKARAYYLARHPLCVLCQRTGRTTPATIVDHIVPHNNNYSAFWDTNNWQSLCATCHSGIKRIAEQHGYSQACDINGLPIDTNHPFNKRRETG